MLWKVKSSIIPTILNNVVQQFFGRVYLLDMNSLHLWMSKSVLNFSLLKYELHDFCWNARFHPFPLYLCFSSLKMMICLVVVPLYLSCLEYIEIIESVGWCLASLLLNSNHDFKYCLVTILYLLFQTQITLTYLRLWFWFLVLRSSLLFLKIASLLFWVSVWTVYNVISLSSLTISSALSSLLWKLVGEIATSHIVLFSYCISNCYWKFSP